MASETNGSGLTRRGFIGFAGTAAAATFLAACSSGGGGGGASGGSSKPIKFWNMPWGPAAFLTEDKRVVAGYKPSSGMPSVSYQQIQWANFTQTFSTAVAASSNPSVSSGGGTTAFLFEKQGKIHYADDVISKDWTKNGIKDDFLPGLLDTMKTSNGYAAVPYNLDMRLYWYNKSLMDKAGASLPTDWDSFEAACKSLKKIGVYGYGTYSGAGAFTGGHTLVAHMINNGGGLFNADQKPDCVTPENIQAMEWVLGLVKNGYVDPRSATYTSANAYSQMNAGKFGMIWDGAGTPASVNASVASNLMVGDPLTGPSGKKGALYFPNNIFMFKNTSSVEGSEAFLNYYYENMKSLWTKKTGIGLPPLKSIAKAAYADDKNSTKIIDVWQPISKTWGAPGQNTVFYNVTKVDGTQPMITFAQSILGGKTTAKAALTTLQKSLESA